MLKSEKSRLKRFIIRRIPRQNRMQLNHSRLFILPTTYGLWLVFLVALLFILGTNYQNNPILIVSYLLFTWLLAAMYLCFFNLNRASITLVAIPDTFAHEQCSISLQLHSDKDRYNWQFLMPNATFQNKDVLNPEAMFTIPYCDTNRGHRTLADIKLESRFPFGLFRCWTFLRFSDKHWVYPKPISSQWRLENEISHHYLEQLSLPDDLQQQMANREFDNEFEELKDYRKGESLTRVSWKHQAKNPDANLLVKSFSSSDTSLQWLTLSSITTTDIEQALSELTFACIALSKQESEFGLALVSPTISTQIVHPSSGQAHLQQCLRVLSCYGQPT